MIAACQRRRLRCAAALALAAFLGAFALRIDQGGWQAAGAGLGALVALVLVLRVRGPSAGMRRIGMALLLGGLALLLTGLAAARLGEARAGIAKLCEGQTAAIAGWTLRLERVLPVAGAGYTALAARIATSHADGPPVPLAPQMRFAFSGAQTDGGVARAVLPSGDLTLAFASFNPTGPCIALDVRWRPLAGVARGGGWLAMLGALLLALAAALALNWRLSARERIAMRREDRPLLREKRFRPAWPVWAGLAPVLAIAAFLAVDGTERTAAPAGNPFSGGASLVSARQASLAGVPNTNRWVVIADAMMRHGQYAEAAEVLLGAVEANPRDAEAWRALGDALYAHAGGMSTPPAQYAYVRAFALAPKP